MTDWSELTHLLWISTHFTLVEQAPLTCTVSRPPWWKAVGEAPCSNFLHTSPTTGQLPHSFCPRPLMHQLPTKPSIVLAVQRSSIARASWGKWRWPAPGQPYSPSHSAPSFCIGHMNPHQARPPHITGILN